MALDDKLESFYLGVWRGIVLSIATIALIVAALASFAALNGLFHGEPYRPVDIKVEDRNAALKQELSIDSFKNSETSGFFEQSAAKDKKSDGGRSLNSLTNESLRKISENLDRYVQVAFPGRSPNRAATTANVKNVMKELKLTNDVKVKFYLSTLEMLSEELAKLGGEQALLAEEKRITPDRLLRWHAETVQGALQAIDQENEKLQRAYQQQVVDYANNRSRIVSYISVAAGALALFVFTIFLFLIIKIERDLKMMAVASTLTTKQLTSPGTQA
jgi:hypothetical protein